MIFMYDKMEITKHKFKYIGISYPKKKRKKIGIMATEKSYKTNKVFIYLF